MIKSKRQRLDDIYGRYSDMFTGEQIVYGSGNLDAAVLFIGEAPGRDEILKGAPFVGKAGKKLQEMLDILTLNREDVYITNTIKYGLRKVDPVTRRQSNRPAGRDEMIRSRPFLIDEVRCIDPKIIVTLGNVPLKTLLSDFDLSVSANAGKRSGFEEYIVYPLLHPAALIYNPSLAAKFGEDLAGLRRIIDDHCKI